MTVNIAGFRVSRRTCLLWSLPRWSLGYELVEQRLQARSHWTEVSEARVEVHSHPLGQSCYVAAFLISDGDFVVGKHGGQVL
jgi:hypothetical protein